MKNRSQTLLFCLLILLSANYSFCQSQMWIFEYVMENGKRNSKRAWEDMFYISNDTLFRHTRDEKNLNDFTDISIIKKVKEDHFLYAPENEFEREFPLHIVFNYTSDTTLASWSEYEKDTAYYRLVKQTNTKFNLDEVNDFLYNGKFKVNLSLLDKSDSDAIDTVSFKKIDLKSKSKNQIRSAIIHKENYYFLLSDFAKEKVLPITYLDEKSFSIRKYDSKPIEIKFIKIQKE